MTRYTFPLSSLRSTGLLPFGLRSLARLRPLVLSALGVSTFSLACSGEEPGPVAGSGGAGTGGAGATTGGGGNPSTGGGATGGATTGGGPATGGAEATGGAASGGAASGGTGTGGSSGEIEVLSDFTVEVTLASEVDPTAPTTVGIVTWSHPTHVPESAYLEFGLDDSYGTVAPVDLTEEGFRTLLLGMKPTSTYHFRVVLQNADGAFASEDQMVETGAATDLVQLGSFDVMNDASRERGFIVTSFWRGDGSSMMFILDADGEVVWWHDSGMNGIASGRISADGKNMWMIEPSNSGAPVGRVTMDGLEAELYDMTVGSHDLTPVSGSTMAFIDYGEADCDSIFTIEPDGTTEEVFDSEEIAMGQCHGNALRYSKDEDVFTLSDVSTDVWVISREGQFLWGLADRVPGGVMSWGGTNHGHHLLDDSFLLFANRGASQEESRIYEYDLDGNEIFQYDGGAFSANLGDVQRLPGGNTFITYSNDGVIQEITPDKEIVLSITTGGQSFGYSLWRESLYGEPSELEL